MGKKIDNRQAFEKEFECLREEVGNYKPEAFDYLRMRFFELYQDRRFKYFFDKELKEGKNPILQWLEGNYYPITEGEKVFLQAMKLLTEESAEELSVLMKRYLFMVKNSPAFRHKVEEFGKHGGNYFRVWAEEKNHFRPVFKEVTQRC